MFCFPYDVLYYTIRTDVRESGPTVERLQSLGVWWGESAAPVSAKRP